MEEMHQNITCIFYDGGKVLCNGTLFKEEEEKLSPVDTMFWVYLGVYIFLMLFAGLVSGLTMGLLSLDKSQLEILEKAGKPKEKKYAARISPIVKRHHLLLVTLLLSNAVAVETMPIFMDRITNPLVAIIVSVTAVLLFGEIVPQALCTRYGLAIGYYLSPVVYFLMFILYIVAWPISKLLDFLLGASHSTFFRRAELKELVNMHQKSISGENEEPLTEDEALIIKGALDLKDKVAKDVLVPLESVVMLEVNSKLDLETMESIIECGHSRIPIYKENKGNVVGLLLVKTIITLDPEDCQLISEVMRPLDSLHFFYEDKPLYDVLNACQNGKCHMCVIKRKFNGDDMTVGIITLEDVIEEILQEEIVDETDKYKDVANRIRVARRLMRSLSGVEFQGQENEASVDLNEKTPLLEV